MEHIVNTQEILDNISKLTGPTLAKLVTRTEVKMNKKDVETKTQANPYVGAVKITTMIVELAPKYEAAVNQQRIEEGKTADFEAQSRKWGTNLGNGLVENNGKLYVSFIAKETVLVTYMFGTDIIDKKELTPFIPKKKPSTTQAVENEIAFRSIAAENIMTVEIL